MLFGLNCFAALSLICIGSIQCIKLEQKFLWKEIEFAWPSEAAREQAITSGRYKPENNLPLGLDIWHDKLFITVPRWKSGVAASLNYVLLSDEKSPVYTPYPSWEANTFEGAESSPLAAASTGGRADAPKATQASTELANNATIISTFRVRVDECDRLWVMDTGLADILGSPKQIAPPALVIFDLKTDQLIKRYTFPASDIKADTFFANVIVDVQTNDCDNAYAYIPDLGAYGVVVYSFRKDESWRVKHNFFHFDPLSGDYNVGGVNFQWTDGVFGMAVGRTKPDGSRSVYFHALSSTKEFEVPNYVLQNKTRATSPASYYDFKLLGERGPNGQSSAEYFDEKSNVLFYTQVNKDGVGCWNAGKSYTPDHQGLVDSDSDALVFPNDLKVDNEGNLYVLSDRMPVFLFSKLNPNEYNYRILKGKVSELIEGTPCDEY